MWRSLLTYTIALLCIAAGLGIAVYKHVELSFPLMPDRSINSWYVELHTTLQSPGNRWRRTPRESSVRMVMPKNTGQYAVVDKQVIAQGFGEQISREDGLSYYNFTKRGLDESESAYLRFVLYELDVNDTQASKKTRSKEAKANNPYIRKNRLYKPDETVAALYDAIDKVVDEAMSKSASPASFMVELWKILERDEETARFLLRRMEVTDQAALLVSLAQIAGYEGRVANGVQLEEAMKRSVRIQRWVELRHKKRWIRFNPENGEEISRDLRLYRWWIGDTPLVQIENFDRYVTTISTKPNVDSALTRALWQARDEQPLAYRLAIQTLPLDQQLVLQILLLMPLGGLIVAFLRQVVGVKTFGTFMPVLIALAFRETGVAFGIAFFVTLTFAGLLLRSYLNRLRLLFVPRLSAVLCVVVALITMAMLGFKDSGIPMGVSVALFPVVIMTMFIERMSTMWDESGPKPALIACIGSIAVAWLVYLVAIDPLVRHAIVTFPELLLVIFGLCLVLGRYNGYRLSEYLRFWQLQRSLRELEKEKKGE